MNSGNQNHPRGPQQRPQNAPPDEPTEGPPRQTLPFGIAMPDDPRIVWGVIVVALWLLLNSLVWIVNNLAWPSYYLVRALDTVTGAAALPAAPFVVWTIWGGIFGGLLGNWLLAPLYGDRENRAWPLYLTLLAMALVAVLLWAFVR